MCDFRNIREKEGMKEKLRKNNTKKQNKKTKRK